MIFSKNRLLLRVVLFGVVFWSCGKDVVKKRRGSSVSSAPIAGSVSANLKVEFYGAGLDSVKIDEENNLLGSSQPLTEYKGLVSCSGEKPQIFNQNKTLFSLTKSSANCLAKLSEFVFSGHSYLPKPGKNFSTYLFSDIAEFESESNIAPLYLIVASQFPALLNTSNLAHFIISPNKNIKSDFIGNTIKADIKYSGANPPAFDVYIKSLTGPSLLSLTGPAVQVKAVCKERIQGDRLDNATCRGQRLSQIYLSFIEFPYYETLESALDSSQSILELDPKFYPPGQYGEANGQLQILLKFDVVGKKILLLTNADQTSYIYAELDN